MSIPVYGSNRGTLGFMGKTRLHSAQSASASAPGLGGWVELARTTLDSANATIDVASLDDKEYYMILTDITDSNLWGNVFQRLGNDSYDSGSNYAWRSSSNGGAEATQVNQDKQSAYEDPGEVGEKFIVSYITNLSNKEKLSLHHGVGRGTGSGAGIAPARHECTDKWANTSNEINQIQTGMYQTSRTFSTGSEVVVLGWSPDDTHTTNFWEQLASVELSGTADNISSGTITAKKYLWIQFYQKSSGDCNINMTFNNDTGSNYARRGSNDGGSDFTSTSASSLAFQTSDTDSAHFFNMFIVNNSANEKLGISHGNTQNTAGADTSPQRKEQVHKWANTSAQITEIDIDNTDSGSYDTSSILKVWGHD